jgi:hypothetical protein
MLITLAESIIKVIILKQMKAHPITKGLKALNPLVDAII